MRSVCDMFAVLTACDSDPCLNGASCNNEAGSFTCTCPDGFTGDTCETSKIFAFLYSPMSLLSINAPLKMKCKYNQNVQKTGD